MLYFQRVEFLGAISLGAAALILLPILAVLASVIGPASDTWAHLAGTLLGVYVVNTALLTAAVAAGVLSIGVLSAWLVTAYLLTSTASASSQGRMALWPSSTLHSLGQE